METLSLPFSFPHIIRSYGTSDSMYLLLIENQYIWMRTSAYLRQGFIIVHQVVKGRKLNPIISVLNYNYYYFLKFIFIF
jgi:hypothetical protein